MGGRVECRAGHPYRAHDPGTAPAPTVTTDRRQTGLWTTGAKLQLVVEHQTAGNMAVCSVNGSHDNNDITGLA